MMTITHDVTEHNWAARKRPAIDVIARLSEEQERERDYVREKVEVFRHFGEIVGDSPALRNTLASVEAVASTPRHGADSR